MIDHVSVRVSDFGRLVAFYRDALAPIGYRVLMEYPGAVGLGADGKPDLWLMQTDRTLNPTHVALASDSRPTIDAFYAAGIAAAFFVALALALALAAGRAALADGSAWQTTSMLLPSGSRTYAA